MARCGNVFQGHELRKPRWNHLWMTRCNHLRKPRWNQLLRQRGHQRASGQGLGRIPRGHQRASGQGLGRIPRGHQLLRQRGHQRASGQGLGRSLRLHIPGIGQLRQQRRCLRCQRRLKWRRLLRVEPTTRSAIAALVTMVPCALGAVEAPAQKAAKALKATGRLARRPFTASTGVTALQCRPSCTFVRTEHLVLCHHRPGVATHAEWAELDQRHGKRPSDRAR